MTVMSTWTIYHSPRDYPGHFVVRRFALVPGSDPAPTDDVSLHASLEDARRSLPPDASACFVRAPEDDESIVETWL